MQATVYRWVDEQGVTHFADRAPTALQAAEVKQEILNTRREHTTKPARTSAHRAAKLRNTQATSYQKIVITGLKAQQTIQYLQRITLNVQTSPVLQPQDRLVVLVDDKQFAGPSSGPVLTIHSPQLYRGAHSLIVVVVDNEGKALARSKAIPFYVRQASSQQRINNHRR